MHVSRHACTCVWAITVCLPSSLLCFNFEEKSLTWPGASIARHGATKYSCNYLGGWDSIPGTCQANIQSQNHTLAIKYSCKEAPAPMISRSDWAKSEPQSDSLRELAEYWSTSRGKSLMSAHNQTYLQFQGLIFKHNNNSCSTRRFDEDIWALPLVSICLLMLCICQISFQEISHRWGSKEISGQ